MTLAEEEADQPRSFLPIAVTGAALRSLKASETVARQLVDDIVVGRMCTGDPLPAEPAMMQKYGVSRETLREGLRLLEVQGLISIRRGPGGGPSVGVVDPANLGRTSTLYFHVAGTTYAELFEAWIVCERMLAELAARNPDRQAVRAVMAPYLRAYDVGGETLEDFVVHHMEFHVALGSLARNRALQLSLMMMGQIVTHHLAAHADPRLARRTIEDDHSAIARAVIAGHSVKARNLMEAHIRALTDFYHGDLGPNMSDYVEWH